MREEQKGEDEDLIEDRPEPEPEQVEINSPEDSPKSNDAKKVAAADVKDMIKPDPEATVKKDLTEPSLAREPSAEASPFEVAAEAKDT